jgi:hypothetical protein
MTSEEACEAIHDFVNRLPTLRFPASTMLPTDGIYFIFEADETGHGARRIVRVGSHTGHGNLPKRLAEHMKANKDRSIFRKNLGRAFLNRSNDVFLKQWDWDLTSKEKKDQLSHLLDIERQQAIETLITDYVVANLSFAVISVADMRSRLLLESALIATIARCRHCGTSARWLGNHSPVAAIRSSGLWLKQHLNGNIINEQQLHALRDK